MIYMPVPGRYIRESFEFISCIRDLIVGSNSPKNSKNGKYAIFGALLKPLESLDGSYRTQKQLKYMPASSRYFREAFEYTNYIVELDKGLEQPKND